jgi:hypothetical protein
MSEYWMPEFQQETRWYMFWLARIFGKKLVKNMYQWRGKIWICGKVEEHIK